MQNTAPFLRQKDRLGDLAAELGGTPSLVLHGTGALRRDSAGRTEQLDPRAALKALGGEPHLVCHAAFVINRLTLLAGQAPALRQAALVGDHLDVAELFAFVCPARFALPTPAGIAAALGIDGGGNRDDTPISLAQSALVLLQALADPKANRIAETARLAGHMARARWPWAKLVQAALVVAGARFDHFEAGNALNVWDRLPDWEDPGPRPLASTHPVPPEDAETLLAQMLNDQAEDRPSQRAYCREVTRVFAPKAAPGDNHVLLAEAGTGLGKTLGYLAPAYLWARRNGGTVWVSTYTKNLQRQLEQETARFYPDPAERARRVVVRKGRENYLCLLNLQEWIAQAGQPRGRGAVLAGLLARWARASRDGDMVGGDFPAWLMPLFVTSRGQDGAGPPPSPASLGLTDRRGECIYAACPHYRKCFIEHAQRKARRADLVIANHALVMIQAALDSVLPGGEDMASGMNPVERLILDEGHHVFDAADSAFSLHLTGQEMSEVRRWVLGPEGRSRRGRGLAERIGDLIAGDEICEALLQEVLERARLLPGPGWLGRLHAGGTGPGERFLALVRSQVHARTENQSGYQLETDCRPLVPGLAEAAGELAAALDSLAGPLAGLAGKLKEKLDDDAAELESAERTRLEATARGLLRRAGLVLPGWRSMLDGLRGEGSGTDFVDWFAIELAFGNEIDVGMHLHWIDPTRPFAELVLERTDGVLITSATLKDRPPQTPEDWQSAEMRTGGSHLARPLMRASYESPFDYRTATRLIVVNDVNREEPEQVAAAYRELFLAAGGGALGLFTAISRLRAAWRRLSEPLAERGLTLYAQHIDAVDIGTLVDLFRADPTSCLLGTDAVRDGVDVPGDSLRLIVLDRVPWPQPTILERARRNAFGGQAHQDMIVRLKLRQAFGRLIRSKSDRGAFVVLDPRLASRFCTVFPEGVVPERLGLVDAIEAVESFLRPALADHGRSL